MQDEFDTPWWKRWLLNRFVATLVILAAIAGGWDLYAVTHNGGIVTGRVVDAAGKPVAGADVTLWVFNFTTFAETKRVTTDAEGRFTITGNPSHNVGVSAEKPGVGLSKRVPIRLYFRSQNTVLKEPLVLAGAG